MNWLDVVLALILLVSIVTSFRKGLTREVISLVSVVAAILLGLWLYGFVGGHLLPYLSSPALAHFAGFVLVVCGVLLLGGVVSFVVGKFLKITGLSFFDHVLGAGFGIVRGILISTALVLGVMAFAQGERPPDAIVQSRLAPYVAESASVLADLAPHELKESFRKTYFRVKTAWQDKVQNGIRSGPNREKAENERQI
ncbi:MAG TPA: CvpA family protein [Bryobacteraceae bacterium]|nr:CvpA family protein [Bryobacteraceae bacterium]